MSIACNHIGARIFESACCHVVAVRYDRGVTLGELIRVNRESKGWSQRELSRRCGVPGPTISRIESGERLGGIDTVLRITGALGIDPELVQRLMRGETVEPVALPDADALYRQAEVQRRREREAYEARIRELEATQIPGARPAHVARGTIQPATAGHGSPAEAESVPYSADVPRPQYIAVRVSGTCLEPDVTEGTVVIVDTEWTTNIPEGHLVVAMHEGDPLVKWLSTDPAGVRWLTSNTLPPIRANGETTIIGVVVKIESEPPVKR